MHVWLAEASGQQQTLLVSKYEVGKNEQGHESTDVLAFSVTDGRCTLTFIDAEKIEWSSLRRLSPALMPLHGILGLLSIGQGTYGPMRTKTGGSGVKTKET